MRTIYKYPMNLGEISTHNLPACAKFRVFAEQNGQLWAWFEINTESDGNVHREFNVYGTGHEIHPQANYLGTTFSAPFVWHLYELDLGVGN